MTPQRPEDSRNTMIFLVCALALMLGYYWFYERPAEQRARARMAEQAQQHQGQVPAAEPQAVVLSRDQAIRTTQGQRVPIATPALKGSINLNGAVIDDLFLTRYRETTDKDSPPVELFRPVNADHAYYATVGWAGAPNMPVSDTPWRLVSGTQLSPGHPIELQFDSSNGLSFHRHISVDDNYMFTVTDTVANTGSRPVPAAQLAAVFRRGLPEDVGKGGNANAFEGAIGDFPGNGSNSETKQQSFKDWRKKGTTSIESTGGWAGLTDKYWLGAVIPGDQKTPVKASFRVSTQDSTDVYTAGFVGPVQQIAPGAQIQKTVRIFAGAKKNDLLVGYSQSYGIPNFKLAIDWGWMWFITQPLFWLLQHIRMGVQAVFPTTHPEQDFSMGLSILLLTVVVRGVMFPLAFKSYASMSKMRKVQPMVEEIRKKYADDQMKQQQEMMEIYKREKINPVAGCLPMLATIPIFFGLYKMLYVTIEMRQQPFLWIKDLAAKDPSTIFNLFGAIPWDPSHLPVIGFLFATYLHIGIWPILYGLTTFLQMQMSPTSTDPTQQTMMKVMPFLFMAFLSSVPVGLLIYYVWSNTITIAQQWFMMNRHGVENPIDAFFHRMRDRAASRKAAG